MNKIYNMRQIIISIITLVILTWAFFNNKFFGRIIISPFLICSLAILGENIFLLLKKNKIAYIFKFIFRISLFIYIGAFLIYTIYYAIQTKNYSLFIIVGIFIVGIIHFLKGAFKSRKRNK